MAPSAVDTDSSAAALLPDEVNRPPAGVVLPPKDIRAIIEKTAGYVARNGNVFEDRIRDKEKTNPKFSFLSQNDAYNPFYAWRLSEVRAGRGTAVSAGRANEAAAPVEPEKPKGPEPPPEFHFSARMPMISAQDLEIVRLTALFVAKNGRSFGTALSQRESRNSQFDFLRPQHSFYQFFSRLVDQYTELLQAATVDGGKPQAARLQELEHNASDRFHVLGRAKQRAEWVKFQEQQKAAKEEEEEKEKLEYAQIDWHDFVVVETVLFNEADDQADLPPPTSLNDLQSSSLEQKAAMSLQPHNMRIEEAFPTEDSSNYYNPYGPQGQQQQYPQSQYPQQPQYPMHPPHTQPIQASYPSSSAYDNTNSPSFAPPIPADDEEARAIAERTEARERAQAAQAAAKGGAGQPMRIRNDYVPRAQAKRQNVQMALCPNCKQQIPYPELEAHMKIELLDPNWKEQRQKSDARQATTTLSTSDVAANLKRLASQRSDVFDPVTGLPPGPTPEEERARHKRFAFDANAGVPPGQEKAGLALGGRGGHGHGGGGGGMYGGGGMGMGMGGMGAPGMGGGEREGFSIDEQLRQLRQKHQPGYGKS
ncbi:SF3a splicing factor complex subunit [Agyrium rufum]|nr:SF3a splicing factor complex subunit [Agyrium rufum]